MATIKAVSSKASVGTTLDYVKKKEKVDEKLLSGIDCTPQTVNEEMQTTKELWGKTDGRTYKHFVQSFAPGEEVTLGLAHKIAQELAENVKAWKGYEVLIATHKDTDHIHTHFVVNSVSHENGYKLQWSKQDLRDMKDYSDKLCRENGLSVTEKGKTFEGKEREETSAYQKDTYRYLQKAEKGKVKSYVQDIALAVMDCKEVATSKIHFMQLLLNKGVKVDWKEKHKYITFTDLQRQQQGEKLCKIRNNKLEQYYNIDFGKEGLEYGFEVNARAEQTREQAREQLSNFDRTTEPNNRGIQDTSVGTSTETIGSFLEQLNADERASDENREDKISKREDRNTSRERQRVATSKNYAWEQRTQTIGKSKATDYGREFER